jgi:hypothetical protein
MAMMENELPTAWLNVMRRLMSVAPHPGQASSIITMRLLVNGDGLPCIWGRPSVQVIEPKSADVESILSRFIAEHLDEIDT